MSKGTTVTMFSKSNETLASNVAAKEAWGHKREKTYSLTLLLVQAQAVYPMLIVKQDQQTMCKVR